MRWFLRSKIHKATVTQAELGYVGSVTIDETLMELSGLLPEEKVLISSFSSGGRLETYVIPGKRDSGVICMNGPAAHVIKAGEEVVIMGFELADKTINAKKILVDKQNKFAKYL